MAGIKLNMVGKKKKKKSIKSKKKASGYSVKEHLPKSKRPMKAKGKWA